VKPMHRFILMTLFCLALCGSARLSARGPVPFRWPNVLPLRETFYFHDAGRAKIDLTIRTIEGSPSYVLHCRAPSFVLADDVAFGGDFDCHLHSLYAKDSYESLLIDDPLDPAEAHSRGEFWVEDLAGSCRNYPEWGAVRNFHVRGMRIRIELTDLEFLHSKAAEKKSAGVSRLRSFRVLIAVSPDDSALSAIAEQTAYWPPWSNPESPFKTDYHCQDVIQTHIPGVISAEELRREGIEAPYDRVLAARKVLKVRAKATPSLGEFHWANRPIPPDDRFVYLPIYEVGEKLAYEFECTAYNVPIGSGKIDRYGLICGLFKTGTQTNLLLDSVDPYSRMNRAIVLPEQLYGECANYPEWGSLRHFLLRGFELTLKFSEPVFASGDFAKHALERVTLEIAVRPVETAISPVATPVKYIYWGISDQPAPCSQVLVNPNAVRRFPATP
jgi:predicted RNA-binding protein with PUA-like domain